MFGMKPLEFQDQLTAEEMAKAIELKERQIAFLHNLSPEAIIGLHFPKESELQKVQSLHDDMQTLKDEIWDRSDPGEEKRHAHMQTQIQSMLSSQAQYNEGYFPGDNSGERTVVCKRPGVFAVVRKFISSMFR